MRNDVQKQGKGSGFYKALSGYLRIVSSGASTVASSVKSAGLSVASSLADDDAARDQVQWSGFDKIECGGNVLREVLLLGYRTGFEVWDVEEADNVHQIASRRDGPVSFLQVQKNPTASRMSKDRFQDVRPLLVVAGESCSSGASDSYSSNSVGAADSGNKNIVSTNIQFYSLSTNGYVHVLKFRSAIYAVRCSSRVVAVSQASQIHCFDAATLEREYTILTYQLAPSLLSSGGIGYGPLAVGSRWLAYSGSPVNISSAAYVCPQEVKYAKSISSSSSTNGSLVAQYAKESSKQFAAGIVTLGDIGYKKLSKYCSEFLQDGSTNHGRQGIYYYDCNGAMNTHQLDMENAGMVIVRDLISKSVVVQFRAHASPISALCFDPSGILLVTASIHGHNINIFCVFPSKAGSTPGSDAGGSYTHLYRLQRGFTDAVIQDISFSDDSEYVIISSSRGTSHLFSLLASVRKMSLHSVANSTASAMSTKSFSSSSKLSNNSNFSQQPSAPVTLSVVSRIRNGTSGWKGAVSGAAAAATGRVSPICGVTCSTFHHCKGSITRPSYNTLRGKYHVLVFSPSGFLVQYVLCPTPNDPVNDISGLTDVPGCFDISQDADSRLVVEAIQRWDVCHKRYRRDHATQSDVYGENGNDGTRLFPRTTKRGTSVYPADSNKASILKLSSEERQYAYISAIELHTHASQWMLWTKPEMCFQAISNEAKDTEIFDHGGGEFEIENIPTHIIEARSRTSMPTSDNLQMPGFLQSRPTHSENNRNGMLSWQKPGFHKSEKHSHGTSYSPLDCMPESTASIEIPNCTSANDGKDHILPALIVDKSVHIRDRSYVDSQLQIVNKNEDKKAETQLIMHVNNVGSLKMESRFLDGDNEID